MMPAPNMKDVFMDLQAGSQFKSYSQQSATFIITFQLDSEQFLHGKAHKGMALGAKNILSKSRVIYFLFYICSIYN